MWRHIANFLGVLASVITIGLFLANIDRYIRPSISEFPLGAESPKEGQLQAPAPSKEKRGPAYGDRIEALGQGAAGLGRALLDVLSFSGKIGLVIFAPWLPAYSVFLIAKGVRYHFYKAWFWFDLADIVWPIFFGICTYVLVLVLVLAVVFPSFLISSWVWDWVAYWADYPIR